MDVVITYVNGLDPVWQADYEKYIGREVLQKRFRDWGTLKYLLRGIEFRMPFIRNVYLVVSGLSQVPDWVNREQLKVVTHKDIIPSEFLPTFNSNPIEMHLHRIPGLDEEFLYFNDDMFPVGDCRPEFFFRDGKAVIGYYTHLLSCNMYKKICRNSDRLARRVLGMRPSVFYHRPQHICSPLLKSECEELYEKAFHEISITSGNRTRTKMDLTQYLFLDYMYFKGLVIKESIPKKHFSTAVSGAEKIAEFILKPSRLMCCINDVELPEEKFVSMRDKIIEAFEQAFPRKSRFEL